MPKVSVSDGLCTLDAGNGIVAQVASLGATLVDLRVPDRQGQIGSVVLGLDRVEDYARQRWFLGATVGRVANRIRDAKFSLDGIAYELEPNDPPHHLHGGSNGWHRAHWQLQPLGGDEAAVALTHRSPAGDAGYPGAVRVRLVYRLSAAGALSIEIEGEVDQPTPLGLAPHAYFNLAGSGTVLDHELTVLAQSFTPGDPLDPTGEIRPVAGTPVDYRTARPVWPELDHNFVLDGPAGSMRPVARLRAARSGRTLEVRSDQPGLQVYAGRYLDGSTSGRGFRHERHAGICLETQAFPNAVNVPAWQAQIIRRPGETYRHRVVYAFGVA
jgi:aldose 1-epimerase